MTHVYTKDDLRYKSYKELTNIALDLDIKVSKKCKSHLVKQIIKKSKYFENTLYLPHELQVMPIMDVCKILKRSGIPIYNTYEYKDIDGEYQFMIHLVDIYLGKYPISRTIVSKLTNKNVQHITINMDYLIDELKSTLNEKQIKYYFKNLSNTIQHSNVVDVNIHLCHIYSEKNILKYIIDGVFKSKNIKKFKISTINIKTFKYVLDRIQRYGNTCVDDIHIDTRVKKSSYDTFVNILRHYLSNNYTSKKLTIGEYYGFEFEKLNILEIMKAFKINYMLESLIFMTVYRGQQIKFGDEYIKELYDIMVENKERATCPLNIDAGSSEYVQQIETLCYNRTMMKMSLYSFMMNL